MDTSRRRIVMASAAGLAVAALGANTTARAQAPKVLKLAHQLPAATGDDGDFRDRLAKKFAAEVEKRTNGQLKIEVYPNGSLVKTFSQFGALRKGTLDMSVLAIAYGLGRARSMARGCGGRGPRIGRKWRRSSTTRASSS